MSISLVEKAGLRWWTAEEIMIRNMFFDKLNCTIQKTLLDINRGWSFERCESPMLVPRDMVSDSYTEDDVFFTSDFALRPETTAGSYRYAKHILQSSKIKMPLCIYQMGKSYRVEKADGASASKYRYNEFTQAEWQCIYSKGTMADYRTPILSALQKEAQYLIGNSFIASSDRLPSYSTETTDVMIACEYRDVEIASISTRTDYPEANVLEIAFGLDRMVDLYQRFHN